MYKRVNARVSWRSQIIVKCFKNVKMRKQSTYVKHLFHMPFKKPICLCHKNILSSCRWENYRPKRRITVGLPRETMISVKMSNGFLPAVYSFLLPVSVACLSEDVKLSLYRFCRRASACLCPHLHCFSGAGHLVDSRYRTGICFSKLVNKTFLVTSLS